MTPLLLIYRRLDALQRQRWVIITTLILGCCGAGLVFGSLVLKSMDIASQRRLLVDAMIGQNWKRGDERALSLYHTGFVEVGDRRYGDSVFVETPDLLFSEEGDIAQPQVLAEYLLAGEYPPSVPRWLLEQPGTTGLLGGIMLAMIVLVVLLNLQLHVFLTLVATGSAVTMAALVGSESAAWAIGGVGILLFSFMLLTRVFLRLLQGPNRVCAVAHTLVQEASRTRVPLLFIILILCILPLLPLGLDEASPLRYRIQTFISRSLGLSFYLAAAMTLFLSCATVAFEIRDRQIWQLVTKPVSHLHYLLGKWLGLIVLNTIILAISSISIFTFIQYQRNLPVVQGLQGQEDALVVRDAVLTARIGGFPAYANLTEEQLRLRVEDIISRDPELSIQQDITLLQRREIRERIMQEFAVGQRTVPPGMARTYRFEGLGDQIRSTETLTLRYRFHILRDDEHETFPAVFIFNEDPNLFERRTYIPTISHVLMIPSSFVREDGSLLVTVLNEYQPTAQWAGYGGLNFEEEDFELLYRAGSFEGNFFRAALVQLTKLAFLGMLGVCCATFLSFPVACLSAFTIFVAGTIGPFLALSLEWYYPVDVQNVDWSNIGIVIRWLFESCIRGVALAIVFLLESFGQYRPTQSLVEGRLITWATVAGGVFRIGILWSGIAFVMGYLVLGRRQLAMYSGHG